MKKINKVNQIEKVGDYEYICDKKSILGSGTFSKVYKGTYVGPTNNDLEHDTPVAIKVIDTHVLSPKSIRILEDESDIMRTLKNNPHPNIVRCYDVYHKYSSIYIIMEYCDSGDLKTILNKPIKEEYARFYFLQFANGLKHLHDNNIVHRDIKPRNILLTNGRKTLKIADFGFARYSNDESLYDTVCGSPLYMAPEIMGHKKYNKQTDLWSIGMILYEMLFGFHPYHSCKSISDLKNIINTKEIEIPPLNTPNKKISEECIKLLKKLLQKDVSDRISWDDFLNYPWLTMQELSTDSLINDSMIGSPTITSNSGTPVNSPDKKVSNDSSINIIHDYYDSMSSTKLDKTNDIESIIEDFDKMGDNLMQFEIELDQKNISVKKVIENSSVLNKYDDDTHEYDIVTKDA